eukprot:CAMPEP_0167785400 /NCGR_PEP_ID=MMETSP0111_2-20121227/8214_1 /TAXON_ID=91324 /ORGANISM="Lotharella globosa, Strain CCCM811" /LENGTH=135 /DNA_ID=CAMNT_0007676663 /DNA_START=32 /DNA_END=439 /DNA_ORIENTATION=-
MPHTFCENPITTTGGVPFETVFSGYTHHHALILPGRKQGMITHHEGLVSREGLSRGKARQMQGSKVDRMKLCVPERHVRESITLHEYIDRITALYDSRNHARDNLSKTLSSLIPMLLNPRDQNANRPVLRTATTV